MKLRRALRNAVWSVVRQRRRSTLAGLGVTVGVAVLVAMVAVGQGAEQAVLERLHAMGTDLLLVTAGRVVVLGGRARQTGNVTTLTVEDAEEMAESLSLVRLAAPVQSQKLPLRWLELSSQTTVVGTTPGYVTAVNAALQEGRVFEEEELRGAARVAVLGPTVVANLFDGASPVGETIRINRIPFEVIGVLGARGLDSVGQDQDDLVLVPISTALRRLFNVDHVNNVYVQAARGRATEAAEEVRELLRARHRIRPGRPDDFTVQDQTQAVEAELETARSFTTLIAAVSSVALLIGGVGVLAVMLIAVKERVREIGLRRAVGATARDILVQFVLEALVVSAAGGLAGLVLGLGAAVAAAWLGGWPLVISGNTVAMGMIVSSAVGVLFGAYPARRAARLAPTVALRSS